MLLTIRHDEKSCVFYANLWEPVVVKKDIGRRSLDLLLCIDVLSILITYNLNHVPLHEC